jgi:hypothetical protein
MPPELLPPPPSDSNFQNVIFFKFHPPLHKMLTPKSANFGIWLLASATFLSVFLLDAPLLC